MFEQYSPEHQNESIPFEIAEKGAEFAQKMNESSKQKIVDLQMLLRMLLREDRVSKHPEADKEDVVQITKRIRELEEAIEENSKTIERFQLRKENQS